ncbi:MAG: hypothetical protein LBS77_05905 [Desulfovibrio sp.]|jgi:hypothetical protein|nr:hypothetical protein [Desulfovibrio sp.]
MTPFFALALDPRLVLASSSGPLSKRWLSGDPCFTHKSAKTCITYSALMAQPANNARHLWLHLSIITTSARSQVSIHAPVRGATAYHKEKEKAESADVTCTSSRCSRSNCIGRASLRIAGADYHLI